MLWASWDGAGSGRPSQLKFITDAGPLKTEQFPCCYFSFFDFLGGGGGGGSSWPKVKNVRLFCTDVTAANVGDAHVIRPKPSVVVRIRTARMISSSGSVIAMEESLPWSL